MMNSTNELTDSLMAGPEGGDGAASSSLRSSSNSSRGGSASLLQRIQMQRHREVQEQQNLPTQQIQVPQYNPVALEENFAGGGPVPPETEGNGFFATAWNHFNTAATSSSATNAGGALGGSVYDTTDGMGADDALLLPSGMDDPTAAGGSYSMSNYFFTFLRDMNGLFYSLPVWARVVVVVVLLYIALKLL